MSDSRPKVSDMRPKMSDIRPVNFDIKKIYLYMYLVHYAYAKIYYLGPLQISENITLENIFKTA